MLTVFFHWGSVVHYKYTPPGTISMFFVSRETQYDKNSSTYGRLVIGSFITTTKLLMNRVLCRVFWWYIKWPGDSDPWQPRYGTLWLLAFPQTKITFEREEISDHWWDSGKYGRAADGDWENSMRSQGDYFEGDWGIIVLCTMFLLCCIFFSKYLYLS